jgi:hypothetical protein
MHALNNTFAPAAPAAPRRQAASLSKTIVWRAKAFWALMERVGQRRAAREILNLAPRLHDTQPEVSARLRAQARAWLAD